MEGSKPRKMLFATPQRCESSSWSRLLISILISLPDKSLENELFRLFPLNLADSIRNVSKRFSTVMREYAVLSIYQDQDQDVSALGEDEDDNEGETVSPSSLLDPHRLRVSFRSSRRPRQH